MIHVLKREFSDSFKSVRSILIILFFTFVSYQSAKFFRGHQALLNEVAKGSAEGSGGSVYTAVIALLVLLFGYLFVFAVSHDIINSETEMKTIRLLVSKVSRFQMMTGKLLGVFLFWVVTISISFAVISMISHSWFLKDYLETLIILFYIISLVIFISTVVPKAKITMFLGILLGIALPVINFISLGVDKWYLIPFKYILPFYYLERSPGLMFIPLAFGLVFFLLSVLTIKRRDL